LKNQENSEGARSRRNGAQAKTSLAHEFRMRWPFWTDAEAAKTVRYS
jgi:hypothetical protein